MNYQEIMNVIRETAEGVYEFAYMDFGKSTGRASVFVEGIGECREVDQYGGESQGEDWWSVKYFPDHDVYIKVEGSYSSYNGTEFYDGWESCREVKPKEKLIIVYQEV